MGLMDRLLGNLGTLVGAERPNLSIQREGDENVPPRGASGTINHKGLLQSDEYNTELLGRGALDIWERMRRSDPAIRETLWHIYAPILNAEKVIEPPSEPTDDELEQAEFVRTALFDWMDQSFEEFLTQALSYLPMGHAVFEPLWKVVERELHVKRRVDPEAIEQAGEEAAAQAEKAAQQKAAALTAAEGNTPPTPEKSGPPDPVDEVPTPEMPQAEVEVLPKRQFVTLRKFSPRLQRTIVEWHTDDAGELVKILQTVAKTKPDGTQDYADVPIGAEDLLVLTNEKWGDEFTGTSILRSAYKPWVIKEMIEKTAAIAYERHGVGVPVAYVPRDREGDEEIIDELESMLSSLRAGESSYLVFSGPKAQGGGSYGYNFEIVSPQGGIPDFKSILEYFRGEVKGALLVRFSELGHAATGARATANIQAEVWYAALHAIARYMGQALDQVIRRLIDANYPNVERYPRLLFQGIEARNLLEFAQSTALLINAGALHPDEPTRAWVRREIDGPAEDPDEAELRSEQDRQTFALEKGDTAGVFEVEEDPAQTARPRAQNAKG